MLSMRRFAFVLLALLFLLPGALAHAQAYTSIVIIGDSLTDTGNDAYVSLQKNTAAAQVPAPVTGYTLGRFTDGTDTVPAAKNYYGVWAEQLAAMLPAKPAINYSLNGGANYAYGFATTNTGTTNFTYGPGMALNFLVNNMGAQLSSYLATNPTITSKTLFIVWGGANDLILAQTPADIGAEPERRTARRDDRAFAAARAAARTREIPRIVRAPEERVIGLDENHQLREVGFCNRDRARRAPRGDVGAVALRAIVRARR